MIRNKVVFPDLTASISARIAASSGVNAMPRGETRGGLERPFCGSQFLLEPRQFRDWFQGSGCLSVDLAHDLQLSG